MRHAITNALILAGLLSPLRAGAVVGTDVVGIGTVPEQVTVSFPNGTAQNVDPTTPGGPVLIVPDGSLPGGFRVIVNSPVLDGTVRIDAGRTPVAKLVFEGGRVQLDVKDAHSVADYLRGLEEQARTDYTAYERYHEVWNEIPESVQKAVYEIWDAQDAANEAVLDSAPPAGQVLLDGVRWAANVADVFLAAYNLEEPGSRALAGEQIQLAREQYAEQLGRLREEAERLTNLLQDAERGLDIARANLTSHLDSFGWWEPILPDDARTNALEERVADAESYTRVLRGQLAATTTALENVRDNAARYEQLLTREAVRNDPDLRALAEQQRFDEAVALSQELALKKQQYVDGHQAFEAQLNALDNKIAQGRQHGIDDAVTQWEKDKVSVQSTFELWQAGMQTALTARGWDLTQAYNRNRADGIGPVDDNALRAEVVARGLDVGILEFTAEQLAALRGGEASPAVGIAGGAVGLDVQEYGWRDFAHDYSSEFYVTFSSWDRFSSRYGAYVGGVSRATKDAVYDIFVLGKEGFDTGLEFTEGAINVYTGSNFDYFGNENTEFIFDLSASTSSLDSELIYQTTQGVIQWADRRFEKQAGSGEKGLLQGLGDAGYVVGTIAGPEEVLGRLAIAGLQSGAKVVRAGRVVNASENLVSAAVDAARVADAAADANRASGAALDGVRATNALDVGGDVARADATLPPSGPAPLPTTTALIGTRGGEVTVAFQGNRVKLTHSDGYTLELGPEHRIGGGSTSEVYAHPNNPGQIIKITKNSVDGGVALDNFGYKVLQDVDPTKLEIPRIHEQFPIVAPGNADFNGGVVSIVDRAPKTIKDTPEILVKGDLTPGQIRAYLVGYGELIARGVVLLDSKWDNWAFRRVGPGDEWVLVAVDLGSVVPVVGRDPAIAERLARDLHTLRLPNADWRLGRAEQQAHLAEEFNGDVDWDGLNLGTGANFRSLDFEFDAEGELIRGLTVPYNPLMAKQFPSLGPAFAPDARLPVGTLPAPTPNLDSAFRNAKTALDESFVTVPPNYFLFAKTALDDVTTGTFAPGYFRGAATLIDGELLVKRPGALVHVDVGLLPNLQAAVGPNLAPFLGRRFVIGACDFNSPETCTNATGVAVFSFPPEQEALLSQQLQAVPGIRYFEPNPGRVEQARLNDPLLEGTEFDQWAIARVGFGNGSGSAWDEPVPRRPVTVAVIDTGVAWGHPDLGADALWINRGEVPGNRVDDDDNGYVDDIVGWNFVDDNNMPWDLDGHGTLVAGIIAARSNNGVGVAGINPQARIMVLRALDNSGASKASHVAEALTYAANNGARVVNLSVGGRDLTETERLAIAHAHALGVVVVVAAGNDSVDVAGYGPAGKSPEAIVVAASDRNDARLAASNWGWLVDVTAPGVDVVGPRAPGTDLMLKFTEIDYEPGSQIVGVDRQYYRATGTSFAAPIVAGTASLLLAARPELTPVDVERMIRNSARDIGAPGVDQFTGYGLLDARAALRADPKFFLEAQINGVRVSQRRGKTYLDVVGHVRSNALDDARIEIGPGDAPTAWRNRVEVDDDGDDVLASIESTAFGSSKEWTLRLLAKHRNGAQREARFTFNVN